MKFKAAGRNIRIFMIIGTLIALLLIISSLYSQSMSTKEDARSVNENIEWIQISPPGALFKDDFEDAQESQTILKDVNI